MSIARIWRGSVKDGDTLGNERISGLYRLMGSESQKAAAAGEGEVVALGRMDSLKTADLLTEAAGQAGARLTWPLSPHALVAHAAPPPHPPIQGIVSARPPQPSDAADPHRLSD